jgi:hypothetical protein
MNVSPERGKTEVFPRTHQASHAFHQQEHRYARLGESISSLFKKADA